MSKIQFKIKLFVCFKSLFIKQCCCCCFDSFFYTNCFPLASEMMFIIFLLPFLGLATAANRLCYGDIKNLAPTGRKNGGVEASYSEVRIDLPYLNKNKTCYQTTADKYCIQASVIAAIASRESRGGKYIEKTNGYGDSGKAYGIMQCDKNTSGLNCTSVKWNSCEHIDMMINKILINFIKQVCATSTDHRSDRAEAREQCLRQGATLAAAETDFYGNIIGVLHDMFVAERMADVFCFVLLLSDEENVKNWC
ncbi:hypothetical protein Btru_031686 [Bulinus truncatus]|nr:hypothetical protein Btru_031686 [Bulinus truncatus]